jgi:hypothetical protein
MYMPAAAALQLPSLALLPAEIITIASSCYPF